MWKRVLCRLGLHKYCQSEIDSVVRLFEKTTMILYQARTLKQLQLTKQLIAQCEVALKEHPYPLELLAEYNKLVKLWHIQFKIWKRG